MESVKPGVFRQEWHVTGTPVSNPYADDPSPLGTFVMGLKAIVERPSYRATRYKNHKLIKYWYNEAGLSIAEIVAKFDNKLECLEYCRKALKSREAIREVEEETKRIRRNYDEY